MLVLACVGRKCFYPFLLAGLLLAGCGRVEAGAGAEQKGRAAVSLIDALLEQDLRTKAEVLEALGSPSFVEAGFDAGTAGRLAACYDTRSAVFPSGAEAGERSALCYAFKNERVRDVSIVHLFGSLEEARKHYLRLAIAFRLDAPGFTAVRGDPDEIHRWVAFREEAVLNLDLDERGRRTVLTLTQESEVGPRNQQGANASRQAG